MTWHNHRKTYLKINDMKKRVLIVEDELGSRMLLEHLLSKRYQVTALANGLEALNWLNAGNVADVVITDIDMPYMSGIDLIYKMENTPLHRQIPIIVLSGEAPEELALLRESDTVDAVLPKPFNLKTLHHNIETSLKLEVA